MKKLLRKIYHFYHPYFYAEKQRWIRFMKKRFLRTFLIFTVANLLMIALYSLLETQQVVEGFELELKPIDVEAGQLIPLWIPLVLLPFTLFLEDFGVRYSPLLVMRTFGINSLEVVEVTEDPVVGNRLIGNKWQFKTKRKWRIWIYEHNFIITILILTLIHALLHQMNVFQADPFGSLYYFLVSLFAGYVFSLVIVRYGFLSCYTLHLSWDLFIISAGYVSSLL